MTKSEEPNSKSISFTTENGTRSFESTKTLLKWISEQKKLYSFKSRNFNSSPFGDVHNEFIRQIAKDFDTYWDRLVYVIETMVIAAKDNEEYDKGVEKFKEEIGNSITSKRLFTSDAPFYEFFKRQCQKDVKFGLAVIVYVFGYDLPNIDFRLFQGIELAKKYFEGGKQLEKDEEFKRTDLINRWESDLESCKQKWIELLKNELSTAKEYSRISKEKVFEQENILEKHTESFEKKLNSITEESKVELDNITRTYDDKLALHSSVKYWEIQQKRHEQKMWFFGIMFLTVVMSVVIGLVIFSNTLLDQVYSEIKINRLISAAVISTFGVWIVKLLANIFMSHMHLSTDAQERRTMMHTYLAMNRKGEGLKEVDRQLILQALFRPSSSGLIKGESGPTHIVDMMNGLVAKKSSN